LIIPASRRAGNARTRTPYEPRALAPSARRPVLEAAFDLALRWSVRRERRSVPPRLRHRDRGDAWSPIH